MKTLTTDQIRMNRSCGLRQEFFAMQIVLNYADGRSSLAEYTELYDAMSLSTQKIADEIMEKISESVKVGA